jgi:hypothetical protein
MPFGHKNPQRIGLFGNIFQFLLRLNVSFSSSHVDHSDGATAGAAGNRVRTTVEKEKQVKQPALVVTHTPICTLANSRPLYLRMRIEWHVTRFLRTSAIISLITLFALLHRIIISIIQQMHQVAEQLLFFCCFLWLCVQISFSYYSLVSDSDYHDVA